MTFDLHHPSFPPIFSCNSAVCFCPRYSYIFGAVTVVAGILGAALGSGLSRWFGKRFPIADPLICAIGLLGSAPCLFATIFAASTSIPATYVRDKCLG